MSEYNITDYIKDDLELQKAVIEEFLKDIKRLQAENDGLKSTNDFVVKQLERRVNQLREYRKALEEIREYIQSLNKDICNNYGWHNTDGCSPNSYVCHDLIEIQNKINEVLK